MRMPLICAGLIAALWPSATGTDPDAPGRHLSTGAHLAAVSTRTPQAIAPVSFSATLPAANRASAEAAHAVVDSAALTSEPLTTVPIEDVCATLVAAADASELPPLFFLRLIWQESRFKQRAVSPAGALGVAQFMPEVAAERGLARPFDPVTALWASAQFLREHYRTFGNLGLAAMAYNAGARRVRDWLARRGKLPEETRKYVTLITGQPPEQWIELQTLDLTLDMPRRAPCGQVAGLAERAGVHRVDVQLEEPIRKVIETAKAEAERKAREAALAKAKKEKERREKEAKAKQAKEKREKQAKAKDKKAKEAKAENAKVKEAEAKDAKNRNSKTKDAKKKDTKGSGSKSKEAGTPKGKSKETAPRQKLSARTKAATKARRKGARSTKSARASNYRRSRNTSAARPQSRHRNRLAAN